jgi:hypothetical protein
MLRGDRGFLRPPIADIDTYGIPAGKKQASRMLACSLAGSPRSAAPDLRCFIARTGVDELIVSSTIDDQQASWDPYHWLKQPPLG